MREIKHLSLEIFQKKIKSSLFYHNFLQELQQSFMQELSHDILQSLFKYYACAGFPAGMFCIGLFEEFLLTLGKYYHYYPCRFRHLLRILKKLLKLSSMHCIYKYFFMDMYYYISTRRIIMELRFEMLKKICSKYF